MPEIVTDRNTCCVCHQTANKKLLKCANCHAVTYCSIECQSSDWTRHKDNCIPLMIAEFDGKGRGLVAARDFEKGELLFEDPAVINVRGISPPNGEWVDHIVINAIKKQMADMLTLNLYVLGNKTQSAEI